MRLRILFIILSIAAIASIPSLAFAKINCVGFTRSLKLGADGDDVKYLQVILNLDPRTKVSDTGPGSPGNESTYFGGKTKYAVEKFQSLHEKEVLTPAGLTKPTGLVGKFTGDSLYSLCRSKELPVKATATATTTKKHTASSTRAKVAIPKITSSSTPPDAVSIASSSPVMDANPNLKPYLIQPASYAVEQGGKLVVIGGGYTPTDNTVYVGDVAYAGLIPVKGKLEVTIPADAKKGKFDLKIGNSKGVSNKTFVIITSPGAVPPKITTFFPKSGPIGTKVTVVGENFSKEWNDIIGGAERPMVVSKDGRVIEFIVKLPIPGLSAQGDLPNVDASLPYWFYIANPNGVSDKMTPAKFTITL
jgi:hypothetical protein